VDAVWTADGTDGPRESVLPNGAIELIFDFGQPQYVVNRQTGERTCFRRSWLAGMQHAPLFIEPHTDTKLLGIRFRPGGLQPFVRFAVSELTDRVEECDLLFGNEFELLRERLATTAPAAERLGLIEAALFRRMRETRHQDLIDFAWQEIVDSGGGRRIRAISRSASVSERHLIARFRESVGVSPKFLARVVRFQRALGLVRDRASVTWSTVAAEAGFFDESHMIREFQLLANATPSTYLRARDVNENHMVIA
jgi:AraC-like DNA-binding protein